MIDYIILEESLNGKHRQFHKTFPALYDALIQHTNWMSDGAAPLERAYAAIHNLTCYPTCTICSLACKWEPTKKRYTTTCGSKQCRYAASAKTNSTINANKSDEEKLAIKQKVNDTIVNRYGSMEEYVSRTTNKRKVTMIERYGVEYTAQSNQLRDKAKHTNLERYGVDNPLANSNVRQKAYDTSVQRYGSLHQSSQEGKQVRAATNLERYGATTPLGSEHIRGKIDATLRDKYGTDVLALINPAKREQTICAKYGVNNVNQAHIPPDVLSKLGDRGWLINQHHAQQKTLVEIANELGVDPKTVGCRLKSHDIQAKRFGCSAGERQLTEFVQSLGVSVESRTRSIIAPYELDLYLPSLKIAIEYCGLYWHSDIHPRMDSSYHVRKVEMCQAAGVRLITIYEDEWEQKQQIVKSKLANIIGKSDDRVVNARDCIVKRVDSASLRSMYDANHIQGWGRGSVCYGLFDDEEMLGAMSFIAHGDGKYELNRFATSCRVRGGFTKLLAAFKRATVWTTIVSYADRRWSEGGVYDKAGFTHEGNTRPSYWYLSPDKTTRIHRSNFRRAKLGQVLSHFDPTRTEFENCDANGVLRVWDCGLTRYTLTATSP